MEKTKTLQLLRFSLESTVQFTALVKLSQASKLISKSLVLSETHQLASDCDILKLLIYSIPINPHNTLFLLETIITKYQVCIVNIQGNEDLVENCWRVFEFVASIEEGEKVLSLCKKYVEQSVGGVKRMVKILEFEEQYVIKNLIDLKKYILKLLPPLYLLIHKNFPTTLLDKLFILKLLSSNSKHQQITSKSASLLSQLTLKYCPSIPSSQSHPIINKTKKHTMKKIQPQNKSSVEKSILEQSVASNSQDIYSLLKSQTRMETFLTYVVCPRTIPADDRIWQGVKEEGSGKTSQQIRKQVSIKLLTNPNFVKEMNSHFSDLLVMFFNLIQRFFKQTDLNSITQILTSFLQNNPIPVSVMIMQTSFLQKIFYHLQLPSIYNFISLFSTLRYKWIREYKDLVYEYFRLTGFFQLLLSNMDGKVVKYLNPLKSKEFTEIEVRLERREVELRMEGSREREIVDLDVSGLELFEGQYQYQQPSDKNLQIFLLTRSKTATPSLLSSSSTKKRSTYLRSLSPRQSSSQLKKLLQPSTPTTIPPPFAVKQIRGYFSTAPVLNFNVMVKDEVVEPHENWCYINVKLYYEVLENLVEEGRWEELEWVRPSGEQLERMFMAFRRYKMVPLNSHESNSVIQTIKIISLILSHAQLLAKYPFLPTLCSSNLTHLYPIINILFHKQRQPTTIQKLNVFKTIDTHTLMIIEVFLKILRAVEVEKKEDVLDRVDESMWQILCLLFFDCMLHNIYQTIVYQIFSQLFTYGSEILLLNILFKSNLVGTLYNAYSDIVKNGVIITEWHIHSFFVYIYKLYLLIRTTKEKRVGIEKVRGGLEKMLSWGLLEMRIKETVKKDIEEINQFTI